MSWDKEFKLTLVLCNIVLMFVSFIAFAAMIEAKDRALDLESRIQQMESLQEQYNDTLLNPVL